MANSNTTNQNKINDACKKALPANVCKTVTQVLKDKGIRVSTRPDVVVRPNIKYDIKERKITGGTITVIYRFGGKKK